MLENRAVLFMDILGFSELVSSGQSERIVGILKRVKSYGDVFVSGPNLRYTSFSDCVVISLPVGDGSGIKWVSFFAALLWIDLLRHRILARGGIAVGLLHHEDNIVVGPALVDAYKLESKQAIYPRVLITEQAVSEAQKASSVIDIADYFQNFTQLVRRDFDGQLHLEMFHRLNPIPPHCIPDDCPPERSMKYLAAVMGGSVIELFNAEKNGPAAAKYYWLWNYFSEACSAQGWPNPFCMNENLPPEPGEDFGVPLLYPSQKRDNGQG